MKPRTKNIIVVLISLMCGMLSLGLAMFSMYLAAIGHFYVASALCPFITVPLIASPFICIKVIKKLDNRRIKHESVRESN